MGQATIRRFAFVAAMLLMAPVWSQAPAVARAGDTTVGVVVGLTPGGAGGLPAIRRQDAGGGWASRARHDHGRCLLALGVLALVALVPYVPRTTFRTVLAAGSSLGRRRHVISLRAPPALLPV
jgi:hypothetical protein